MPPGDWTHQIESAINLGDKPTGTIPASESLPEKMSKDEQQRYNSFINYYIHQVNLIRYLLGEDYDVEFIDKREVLMVCKSKSGVTVALEMNAYEIRDEWQEYYKACFDKGFVSMSLPAPMARQRSGNLIIYRNTKNGGTYENPVIPPVWCMREQARLFIEEVQGKMSCISPAADAVKDLEIAEAFIAKSKGTK
jgi:predicted dehydrogenase